MRETFVLYTSQYEAVRCLSLAAKGELFDALFSYVMTAEAPSFSAPEIEMAFRFMRQQIDRDQEKYTTIVEKRRAAGRRGGRPRKPQQKKLEAPENSERSVLSEKNQKPNRSQSLDTQPLAKAKNQQKQMLSDESKRKQTNPVYVYDNVNVDTSVSTDVDTCVSEKETNVSSKKKEKKSAKTSREEQWEKFFMDVLRAYNECRSECPDTSMSAAAFLSDDRRAAIREIVRKYNLDIRGFRRAFHNALRSPFCNGRDLRNRRTPVDLTWLLREQNFMRAFEGSL